MTGNISSTLSGEELMWIHRGALRILEEMGMEIQNRSLLEAVAEIGASVDFDTERARFPRSLVERFLAEAEHSDWSQQQPRLESSAGVYHGLFLNPVTDRFDPWTETDLAIYFRLARSLPLIGAAHMLGCRLPVSPPLESLYERFYCWKHGASEGGSVYGAQIGPFLRDFYQVRADSRGKPARDLFHAAVYLVPPLKLGREEAAQVEYFRALGWRVEIGGGMGSMGATAPATLAGAVTLNLAEQLALRLLDWALFGRKELWLGGSLAVLDMRTMIRPYGRPEMAAANVMTARLARHYGGAFRGHAGLTDAKKPSPEAGAQKMLTAIPTLLEGGHIWLDAGLLAIDEVCSPVQMVLDHEMLSALSHLAREWPVNEETLALETILEVGPGGNYLDQMHTALHFRQEHWEPRLWSRQMLRPWLESDGKLDVDKAREMALAMREKGESPQRFSQEEEKELSIIIEHARKNLCG